MWLERFGTSDVTIFYVFCAVVLVLVTLSILFVVFGYLTHDKSAGRWLPALMNFSTLIIAIAVLFRGVRPEWTDPNPKPVLSNICQVFSTFMVIGYSGFGIALTVKLWALYVSAKSSKIIPERQSILPAWLLLVISGIAALIWTLLFSPGSHLQQSTTYNNSNTSVYICGGWYDLPQYHDNQFIWRVVTSCYFAALLLMSLLPTGLLLCVRLKKKKNLYIRVNSNAFSMISVNSLVCVAAGILVWYLYNPSKTDEDSVMYAIIGGLQLWMLILAQIILLVSRIIVWKKDSSKEKSHSHNTLTMTVTAEYTREGFSKSTSNGHAISGQNHYSNQTLDNGHAVNRQSDYSNETLDNGHALSRQSDYSNETLDNGQAIIRQSHYTNEKKSNDINEAIAMDGENSYNNRMSGADMYDENAVYSTPADATDIPEGFFDKEY